MRKRNKVIAMAKQAKETKVPTRVSVLMNEGMKKQGIELRELSILSGVSYEYIRMLASSSERTPKMHLLRAIAKVLKLDFAKVEVECIADKLDAAKRKLGPIAYELEGQNPELLVIDRLWNKLSKGHKADTISMVKAFAERDSA